MNIINNFKSQKCGKEFIHEKDQLNHARKEHDKEMREQFHRDSYPEEYGTAQDRVTPHTSHLDDKILQKVKIWNLKDD